MYRWQYIALRNCYYFKIGASWHRLSQLTQHFGIIGGRDAGPALDDASKWATIFLMQIGTNYSQLQLRVGGQRHCMQEQSKGLSLTKL